MTKTISALCHTAHHIPTAPVLKYLNYVAEECWRQNAQAPTHCNAVLYHIEFHIPTPLILAFWKSSHSRNLSTQIGGITIIWWRYFGEFANQMVIRDWSLDWGSSQGGVTELKDQSMKSYSLKVHQIISTMISMQQGSCPNKFGSIFKRPVNILKEVIRSAWSRRRCKEWRPSHWSLSSQGRWRMPVTKLVAYFWIRSKSLISATRFYWTGWHTLF